MKGDVMKNVRFPIVEPTLPQEDSWELSFDVTYGRLARKTWRDNQIQLTWGHSDW